MNWILLFIVICVVYFLFQKIEYFTSHDPVLDELRNQLAVLHPKFKDVELYEGKKSYTINKEKVYICTKDTNGRYYSRNMLCYVILHEYAHMICDEIGHTRKFQTIFDDLLQQASDYGLYNPSIPPLTDYCGHD